MAAAVGSLIILVFTRHGGIGVSPDSVNYLSAARNLFHGQGLIQYDGEPMVDFPFFYPAFLSLVNWISRVDPMVFAPVLNAGLFALLLYLTGSIMNGFAFPSTWYKRVLLSFFVLSPALLEVYSMLWSETLFLIVLLAFFIALKKYLQSPLWTQLLLVSAIAALACSTRYAGITVVATGGLCILVDRKLALPRKWGHLALYALIGNSLLIANLVRNHHVSATLAGYREAGVTPFFQNIFNLGYILSDWLPVPKENLWVAMGVVAIGLAACSIVLMQALRKKTISFGYESISALFCLVFGGFMIITATYSRFELFSSRLLCPLFIPFLWASTAALPRLVTQLPRRRSLILAVLGLVAAAGFQYNQFSQDYETYDGVKDAGIPGYTEDPWPESPLVTFLKNNKGLFAPGYKIYSNGADAFYLYTGISSILLPEIVFPNEVDKYYAGNHQYLVWFNDIDNPDVVTLPEILKHKSLVKLQQFSNGWIYTTPDSAATSPGTSKFSKPITGQ